MPLLRPFERLQLRTARLSRPAAYGLATAFVLIGTGVRAASCLVGWPSPVGFMFMLYAIAASATLNRGTGYLATLLATLASIPFLPTVPDGGVRPEWVLPLVVFILLGMGITALIESLAHALNERSAALIRSQQAGRRRELLLIEYRHRSRGDLQAISSLLRLRARFVADAAGKLALHEAAGHTVALGRIHTRLERARHDADETATVDTGPFVVGVCADMVPPVPDAWGAPRWISTDRAVSLGLLLVELVAEARRGGAGRVMVRLAVVGADFLLDVIDDRETLGASDGMRQRLIELLAVQLRGKVTRAANLAGAGWSVTVRFPVLAPSLAPGHVGTGPIGQTPIE